jgi:hypothetical protein
LGGGQGRGRTADLPIFSRTLVPTELPGRACCLETFHDGRAAKPYLRGGCVAKPDSKPDQSVADQSFWTGGLLGPMLAGLRPRLSSGCDEASHDQSRPPSSSGLGRRPFTAVARVRIPLGVPPSVSLALVGVPPSVRLRGRDQLVVIVELRAAAQEARPPPSNPGHQSLRTVLVDVHVSVRPSGPADRDWRRSRRGL